MLGISVATGLLGGVTNVGDGGDTGNAGGGDGVGELGAGRFTGSGFCVTGAGGATG